MSDPMPPPSSFGPPPGASKKPPSSRAPLIVVLLGIVVALAIVGYSWWKGRQVPAATPEPAPVAEFMEEGAVATLEEVQRQHILRVLARTQGRLYGPGGAAALLGLKPSTLQSRMKKLGITRLEQYVATPPSPPGK